MTRIASAITIALMVGLSSPMASAAESCPICKYLPEEWGGPKKAAPADKRRSAAQRAHARRLQQQGATPGKIETAKAEIEKSAPSGTVVKTDSITAEAVAPAKDDHKLADVGCMNFFPTVGKSLPVPCE